MGKMIIINMMYINFLTSKSLEEDISNKNIDSFYKKFIPIINPDAIVSIGWADRTYQRLLLYQIIIKYQQ